MATTANGIGQVEADVSSDSPTLTQIDGQMVASSVTMDQMFSTKGLNMESEEANAAQSQEEKTKSGKNADAKKERLSQKEWQDAQEKAKKTDELQEENKQSEQEKLTMKQEIAQLKELNARRDWEAEHPIVRDERYKDDWDRVNGEKRFSDLTYEERWRLISNEDATKISRAIFEDREQERSSVPFASRGMPQEPQLEPETAELGKYWGNSPEDFKKYGLV